ncbi:MAG: RNA polymerase sigma factor [Dysgonamonadaceae bacterium]|jgi:RNA polymerase sigma-70 factor (ECF subfamily)|nr:RNA polymerase sigma factor [Dysgonamonadaceae bacterium]
MRQDRLKKNILPIADKLFRLALSITGNKEDAEDVVQDVYYNVWKKRDEWEAIENLEAYCFRSVRNTALDKIVLKENQHQTIPDDFDFPVQGGDIQHEMEVREQIDSLEKWLKTRPEIQQTIFLLREIEGMSYKEIATVLNISEEQVKAYLFRLRRKLKEYFEKMER